LTLQDFDAHYSPVLEAIRPTETNHADRKCFVSTATSVTAHKTLVRAAPRHPANASRLHSKLRTRSPLFARFSGAFARSAGF